MSPPVAFLFTLAVCTLARPQGQSPAMLEYTEQNKSQMKTPEKNSPSHLNKNGSKSMDPYYANNDENPSVKAPREDEWINKAIKSIGQMGPRDNYVIGLPPWIAQTVGNRPNYQVPVVIRKQKIIMPYLRKAQVVFQKVESARYKSKPPVLMGIHKDKPFVTKNVTAMPFALKPTDKDYYDPPPARLSGKGAAAHAKGKTTDRNTVMLVEPPRKTRQNPILSKSKHLVRENLEPLRIGLSQENSGATDVKSGKKHHNDIEDPSETLYFVALIAAIGAILAIVIVSVGYGWYTLSKKAKAAADVDYPAYGVTGPTMDTSGDRKLAHSAHMYHYQHQKQQIIAMERNLDQRAGSMSDAESEEENEEGDYTVYECPGFATTGAMEVKNPLFSDDPPTSTPGKCEIFKLQPKD